MIQHNNKLYYGAFGALFLLAVLIWTTSKRGVLSTDPPRCTPSSVHASSPLTVPDRLVKYHTAIFQSTVDPSMEKFTIVMLTYKRDATLPTIILHYCNTPRLARIVVIWNDVSREIPEDILSLRDMCCVSLVFVRETENKITNRFKPRPEIQTDCVFVLDDDLYFTNLSDVTFAFNVWQEHRHRIVGFVNSMRSHSLDSDGRYSYDQPSPGRGVSIMMTCTAFLHKAYLDMYFDASGAVLPANMLQEEDWTMYCDDILMNCMVGRFLELVTWPQPNLVAIKPKSRLDNIEGQAAAGGGHPGLHKKRPDHYSRRTECLNKLAAVFDGHLPLRTSTVIVHESRSEGLCTGWLCVLVIGTMLIQTVIILCLARHLLYYQTLHK